MKLTVAVRIASGFVVTVLLLSIIAATSLSKLSDIKESTEKVNTLAIPALTQSSNLQSQFVKMGKSAVQLYYTTDSSAVAALQTNFDKNDKEFKVSYDKLSTVVASDPQLKTAVSAVYKSYNEFNDISTNLFSSHSRTLALEAQIADALSSLEEMADDAASLSLDLTDSNTVKRNHKEAFEAANALETNLNSLVSAATDLSNTKSSATVETISNEIEFTVSSISEKYKAIEALSNNDNAPEVAQELTEMLDSVLEAVTSSDSIIQKKRQLLQTKAQSTELLQTSEATIDKAVKQLENLFTIAKNSAKNVQTQVEDQVTSGYTSVFIIVALAIILSVIIGTITFRSIIRPLGQVNELLNVVASGDMTKKLDDSGEDEFADLARNCNQLIDSLRSLIQGIVSRSTQLAAASEETSAITKETTQAVNNQRAQVEQAATATTEMSSTSQAVLHSSQEALDAIQASDEEAERVKRISEANKHTITGLAKEVDGAAAVINKLHQDSASIGGILDVIRGIADQTNLLALNAAIEAARAGEQGRGFAVVADEVRSLASKTQDSTREIQSMIEVLQHGAEEAVAVMDRGKSQAESCVEQSENAAQALQSITDAVHKASNVSEEIAQAAKEQNQVTNEISERLESVVAIAEQTATGAEQTADSSHEVARLAEELRLSVEEFKL